MRRANAIFFHSIMRDCNDSNLCFGGNAFKFKSIKFSKDFVNKVLKLFENVDKEILVLTY